jgi:adenosylmethionine-8-amino-7-oxononanoate aminotransferase
MLAEASATQDDETGRGSGRSLAQLALDHVWIHGAQHARLADEGVLVLEKGEGCTVWDVEGNAYFDAFAGLAVVNAGYGRREIADAAAQQAARLPYVNGLAYTAPPTARLARKLAELLPGDLSRVFFCSGGSEATESAMKIAKQYHVLRRDARRFHIIGRRHSYHGSTMGSLSVSGNLRAPTHRYFDPLMPGALHVPGHYCYRCDYRMSYPACELRCADAIEQEIQFHGEGSVAAVIGEPVPAGPGALVPPPEYWRRVREICDQYGVLLIADEVINGFGRTGRMFACEHWGLQPDLITLAKAMSSGHAPIGAAVARLPIAEGFVGEDEKALRHVFSFGGHPPSCAAALKNIEIIERERLVENARVMGSRLLDGLETLRSHPIVGDVRGIGLLAGVELVIDRRKKTPISADAARMIGHYLKEESVLTRVWNVLSLAPPLCISLEQVDWLVEVVDRVLSRFEKEKGLTGS